MTNHHSENVYAEIARSLREIASKARYSKKDDCIVVLLRCRSCGSRFDELYSTAHDNIVLGVEPVCIKCDKSADQIHVIVSLSAIVQWMVSL